MNRLQKFIEIGAYGEGPTRTAYVLELDRLPAPQEGNEWRLVEDFNAGNEILADASLKEVFKAAIRNGYAVDSASKARGGRAGGG